MSGAGEVIAPVPVSPIWLIVGIGLLVTVIGWIGLVYWLTRHRPEPTLANVAVKAPYVIDVAAIKQRYLDMLAAIEHAYQSGEISAREAHQKISYAARCFVYEVTGKRAYTFTLQDLEKSNLTTLRAMIRGIYPDEFDAIAHGTVAQSAASAQEMVRAW